MKIALVLGYGLFTETDLKYKNYLEKVLVILKKEKFDKIIFCGGYTKPGVGKSEASTMAEYILKLNNSLKKNIILEDKSFTTFENITFAKAKIESFDNVDISIICDSIRMPKISVYAGEILKGYDKENIMNLISKNLVNTDILSDFCIDFGDIRYFGLTMDRTKKEIADQIVGSIVQVHYSDFTKLHDNFLADRKKKWGF